MAKAITKPAISAEQKQKNKKQLRIQIKRHWMLYLFLLPCIIWLLVFCYAPMAGIVLAFKNYRFDLGILSYFPQIWASDGRTQAFQEVRYITGVLDDH